MSYKTILVHVDETRRAIERIRLACNLALAADAHVTGIAFTGISRFLFLSGASEMDDPNLAAHLDMLRNRAKNALESFEHIAQSANLASFDAHIVDDEASAGVSLQARYSDLVVIGQNDPDERSAAVMPDFPEYVVMNSGRPVLIVPRSGRYEVTGNRVLIAWDAGMESARAVSMAMPILKRAAVVQGVIFNASPENIPSPDKAAEDFALYLSRHGITAEVTEWSTEKNIGDALLSAAANLSSDLLVMGGYGHSRFREVLLGGATRTILDSMTLPVLMAH
jgi:nucleotide-binding universal stress UspA family protein